MRVFVTGATGFIGTAVVQELIGAGHQVVGLARSDTGAEKLKDAGAEVHRGDLEDAESLRGGAVAADAVIHTGFIHDFARFAEVCETDRRAIEALGSVLVGSDRPLIITSGTALMPGFHLATEDSDLPADNPHPRAASERAAASVAALGVRVATVRLPPTVHGDGDHGFVPLLAGIARDKGVSAYIGEGVNRWPAVHRLDAAGLFRLALEKPFDPGAKYHGVAQEGVPFREIAEVIGKHLDIPVVSITPEEAADHFGWFQHFAAIDNPTSGAQTREQLGWSPEQAGLITDIDRESYFEV